MEYDACTMLLALEEEMRYATQPSPGLASPNSHVQPNNEQTITVDTGLPPSSLPPHSGLVPGPIASVRGSPGEADAGANHTPTSQPSELTSHDLRAPVSAMHNMGQYEESNNPSKTPTSTAYSADHPSIQRRGLLFSRDAKQKDMVSKGIIDQRPARQLFNT
ncbi:hypothetical protein NW762_010764 [Fusarium torreyae]|uniref:Uncharacterized protein n=1 Tax=Fusarium torreyae TaxID=1237075 RepID=A0A9W8VD66_9HYPO|nr:hypothetical protein NW762_010764 [Fusarium torreyae]